MAQQARERLALQKLFKDKYLKQQNKSLNFEEKAEKSSKCNQQIEMLKMALSMNQDNPEKMKIY